jgi:CYTH domain-containing protein
VNREIERKFLVERLPDRMATLSFDPIDQGYLAIGEDGTEVRLRRMGGYCYLTVKSEGGLVRQEQEIELDPAQFEALWPATEGKRLRKRRYTFEEAGHMVELDVYQDQLDGLLVAEVEFETVRDAEAYQPAAWFGREVTGMTVFKNKKLVETGDWRSLRDAAP